MPIWLEILINVIGYVGFIAIATLNPFSEEAPAHEQPREGVS